MSMKGEWIYEKIGEGLILSRHTIQNPQRTNEKKENSLRCKNKLKTEIYLKRSNMTLVVAIY